MSPSEPETPAVPSTHPAEPGGGARSGEMRVYGAETADLLVSQNQDPLLRHLTGVIRALASQYAPPARHPSVLDVGCGVGRSSLALAEAGYSVVGVDPSERVVGLAVDLARQHPALAGRLAFYVGDATVDAPEAWRGAYDLAVCSEVIEHVAAPEAVLAYLRQVLRPDGILILTTPHDPRQWTAMDSYAGHVQRFGAERLLRLLGEWDLLELSTEGFPFQRTAMWTYDRLLAARGGEHRFDDFGHSPLYRVYTQLMPGLLRLDHALRGVRRGTTWVAVARKID